jgi:hypothetical protein
MRALPLALALLLAIPATMVVAMPKALPEFAEPFRVPASAPGDEEEHAHEAQDDAGSAPAGDAHAGHAARAPSGEHQHARERTVWPAAEGAVPTSTEGLVEVSRVHIEGKPARAKLAEQEIPLAGTGTLADPYVLEGLYVRGELELQDTSDYYVVRNSIIGGTLRLNWNDDRVHVHHNKVRDLRVNENIERKGEATGGLIELNVIGVVGQIRHFDGVLRANEVGPIPSGFFDDVTEDSGISIPFAAAPRAVNIDGFDGALFEENTILGYVEMQLHGHHHASCFACHSHNHAVSGAMEHDHTIRYHEADFIGNTIVVDEGVAFRYTDAVHRGDDRTARSEPNKDLELPHVHYTRLAITDNVVEGGPMVIDILNADSRDHENEETDDIEEVAIHAAHAYRADLLVARNAITWALPERPLEVAWLEESVKDGLLVRDVKEAHVALVGNVIVMSGATSPRLAGLPLLGAWLGGEAPSALQMADVRSARLLVEDNELAGAHFGILARAFAEDATWIDGGNAYKDVKKEIEADQGARPERSPE